MKIEIIDPLKHRGWDDMVLSTKDYSFFHSSSWAHVLSESYAYKPLYFTILDKSRMLALLPLMEINSFLTGKRGVSLPFSDYCEPMVSDGVSFREIFDFVITYGKRKGWKYLEFRGAQAFFEKEKPTELFFGHTLDFGEGAENILTRFRESTRRNIKKAEKEGVRVSASTSLDDMKVFYNLNCLTRKYHGLPPQPFSFFKAVHQYAISEGFGFVMLASYKGSSIAGAVFFHFGRKAFYKYGASDRSYQYLRANNLIMWEAIKGYAQNRYKSFCFGRTESDNKGLRQFKTGWGTKEYIMKYYKYNLSKNAFMTNHQIITASQNKILSKMPIPLLRWMGSLFYKHIG